MVIAECVPSADHATDLKGGPTLDLARRRLVRTIAEVGKAVIVGRAGSEVTRGLGPAVSVRLVHHESDIQRESNT